MRRIAAGTMAILSAVTAFVTAAPSPSASTDPPGYVTVSMALPENQISEPVAMNEAGQVVGVYAHASFGVGSAFFWDPTTGVTTDLGRIAPGAVTPKAINANGTVVGNIVTSSSSIGFVWTMAGGMVPLVTSAGDPASAVDINDAGQIAAQNATGELVLIQPSTATVVGGQYLGRSPVIAEMNNSGEITGGVFLGMLNRWAGFRWTAAGGFTAVPATSVTDDIQPQFINASGNVAGIGSITTFAKIPQPFLHESSSSTSSLQLGATGAYTFPRDLNDVGEIVGQMLVSGSQFRAFRWSAAMGMVDLGVLVSGGSSDAKAMNDTGVVVGTATDAGGTTHPVRWDSNGIVDLGLPAVPNGPAQSGQARLVNDDGLIAGSVNNQFGQPFAFVWVPVDRAPAAPTAVTVTDQGDDVLVSWPDPSLIETGFEVQRARWNGSAWVEWTLVAVEANVTSYLDHLVPAGQYAYLVRAVNSFGVSAWTTTVHLHFTAPAPPMAPSGVVVVSDGSDVSVSWVDNSANELVFEVLRARWVAGVWSEWHSVSVDANSTSYTDEAVPDGFYAYLVRATNPLGSSGWAIAVVEHTTASGPPSAPTNLTAASSSGNVQLTWTDTSATETLFEVMRARYNPTTATWDEWTSWVVDRDASSFTDVAVSDGQYAYLVRARNAVGESVWVITVLVHASSSALPAAPTVVSANVAGSTVTVAWADNATNEVAYEILRAASVGGSWANWTTRVLDRNTTSYVDIVPPGEYAYLVRSTNANGSSQWETVLASVT